MANMNAQPEDGSGKASKQSKRQEKGVPKSQSDHNLILMSNNLAKNMQSSEPNQPASGGKGTRHK